MNTLERRRMIKVEIRGLPEARHMQMYISEKMNRVGDLARKLKHVYNKDIKKTDEIKIYRDKFHLPDHENINIIETGEEIIAYRRESEYVEEKEGKEALVKVREQVLQEMENNLNGKEMELKRKEASLETREENVKRQKVREEVLKDKENKFATQEMDLQRKEASLEDKEVSLKRQEEDIKSKLEDLEYREMVWRNDRWDVDEELKQGRKALSIKDKRFKRRNKKLNQREARVKAKELELDEVSKVKENENYEKAIELNDREMELDSRQEELDKAYDKAEEKLNLEWMNLINLKKIFKQIQGGVE